MGFSKISTKIAGATMGVMNAAALAIPTAYASYGVWGNVANITGNLFNTLDSALRSIVVPIAGVVFLICLIMMMVSQNQKKVETYRAWAISTFVCIIVIYAVPFIIGLATSIGQSF